MTIFIHTKLVNQVWLRYVNYLIYMYIVLAIGGRERETHIRTCKLKPY